MKKIGIISQLDDSNVNYGNRLQAYALNNYINKKMNLLAESIILKNKEKRKTTKFSLPFIVYKSILRIRQRIKCYNKSILIKRRVELCNDFMKNNILLNNKKLSFKDLKKSDYDILIVGSDVVWSQSNHYVNRIKFLDFKTQKDVKKVSYAASFGKDYIPTQNIPYVKRCLESFHGISVRERSSVEMLKDIGIDNALHAVDPTLLLSKEEWIKITDNPKVIDEKYIFVYLLGKDVKQREYIANFAKERKLKVVNIIHANGIENKVDEAFGDVKFSNCSPENWLWLINNAEYIFTDSFHGCVLSTILEKRVLVLRRDYSHDINNRMIDFLKVINESDKYIDVNNPIGFNNIVWNYNEINQKLDKCINYSKDYLDNMLKGED